jgi:hypothetical protein
MNLAASDSKQGKSEDLGRTVAKVAVFAADLTRTSQRGPDSRALQRDLEQRHLKQLHLARLNATQLSMAE